MASELDTLRETIMTVVNGQVSPTTLAVQAAQDAAKKMVAEAKYMVEMTKIIVPQQAKLTEEIAILEGQKMAKSAEKAVKDAEVVVIDTTIAAQRKLLDVKKSAGAILKKQQDKAAAKAKAHGNIYNPSTENSEDSVRKIKENIDKQQNISNNIHNEIDSISAEIGDIQNQIDEKQKTIKLLAAQLSPSAALMEAQIKTQQAQSKVDNASTPEAKMEAEKDLEDIKDEEMAIQTISDDHDIAIKNNETQNEPKMIQLRAEYQIMDSGVNILNYLITNLPILGTSIMSVPSTIVAGSATGVANPALAPMWGNVLYGYAFFILATVKAASIRFLALAQELSYTPTTEMTIINMIAPTEAALKGIMGTLPAPAGAVLI